MPTPAHERTTEANDTIVSQRVVLGILYGPVGGMVGAIVAAFVGFSLTLVGFDLGELSLKRSIEMSVIMGAYAVIGGYIGSFLCGAPLLYLLIAIRRESVVLLCAGGFLIAAIWGGRSGHLGAALFAGWFGLSVAIAFSIFSVHIPRKLGDRQRFRSFFKKSLYCNFLIMGLGVLAFFVVGH